jgi:hypothetical protein
MDQMIELFNDGNISKNNCKIDRNKLLFSWKEVEINRKKKCSKEKHYN